MTEATAGRLDARSRRILLGVALVAVGALYLPFLGVPWEYDDKVEILRNRVIRHPGDLREMVRYNPFRVLLLYTFAADLWAWGIDRPAGFRAVNIAVHAANVAMILSLLDRLGARLGDRIASQRLFVAAGTLAFAVHPLAIESVTYVSGRSSSLATLFVLASILSWVRYRELSEQPDIAAWQAAVARRTNLAVGTILGAGLLAGLPVAMMASAGTLDGRRAVTFGLGGAGVLLVIAAAGLAPRWREANDAVPARPPMALAATRAWTLSWAAFVAGCLTKEIAAVLPALLFVLEGTVWTRSWRAAFGALRGRLFPFFAIPAFLVVLRAAAYGYVASPVFIRPWTTNLLTQFEVVGHYVRLAAVPWPQSIFHEYAEVPPPGDLSTWLVAAALIAAVVGAARLAGRAPALAFGVLVAAVAVAPTSSVFALKETMVEHRTYLPSVGGAFIIAWAFGAALPRKIPAAAAAALLAGVLTGWAVLHVSYDLLWQDEEVLWTHAVRVNPDATEAWRNLGDLFTLEGRLDDAADAYAEAVRADPGNIAARGSRGMVLARAGRMAEAERALRSTLEVAPCHTPSLNNLATLRARRSDISGAVDLYDTSLQCNPNNPLAHLGLGHIYYDRLPNRAKAAEHYGRFLDLIDPHHRDVQLIKRRLLELTW